MTPKYFILSEELLLKETSTLQRVLKAHPKKNLIQLLYSSDFLSAAAAQHIDFSFLSIQHT